MTDSTPEQEEQDFEEFPEHRVIKDLPTEDTFVDDVNICSQCGGTRSIMESTGKCNSNDCPMSELVKTL